MNPKSFREIIGEDVKQVFLNPSEFGEEHKINGKPYTILVDNNEMLEREKRYRAREQDGIFTKQILFYVSGEEFGPLPAIGRMLELDNNKYRITDAISEGGVYSISLEAIASCSKSR